MPCLGDCGQEGARMDMPSHCLPLPSIKAPLPSGLAEGSGPGLPPPRWSRGAGLTLVLPTRLPGA